MSLTEVTVPPRERRIGDYAPRREPAPKRQIVYRYAWSVYTRDDGGRGYFARVNESLVLNVHRRPNSRTWEYLIVGFDLTKDGAPAIGHVGTSDTMGEAKYLAEQRISKQTPGTQMALDELEELPF